MFPDLPNHPTGEVAADARFRMPVAECSVGSVDSFSQLGGITGSFPLVALASRCASPQLIRDGGWGAADLSGDGTRAEALLLEDIDGSSAFCFTASRILNGVKISMLIIHLFIR